MACVLAAYALLFACGEVRAQSVLTNLLTTGVSAQYGSATNNPPQQYAGNQAFQSLTNSSSLSFSNITAFASSELTYLIVTPQMIQVRGRLSAGGSLPSAPSNTLRGAASAAGAVASIGISAAVPIRYNLNLAATLPVSENVSAGLFTFRVAPTLTYQVVANSAYAVNTNSSSGGSYNLNCQVVSTNLMFFQASATLGVSWLDASGVGTNASRSGDFTATVGLPYLDAARAGAQLVIKWPTNLTSYALQRNTSVNTPGGWTTVSAGITQSNGFNMLSVPLSGLGPGVYRLKQ